MTRRRDYISNALDGAANDDLAGLIADMLRDGDLQRVLAQRKLAHQVRVLGPELPKSKKGTPTWKMLGRRVDRRIVDEMLGSPLFQKDENSLKLVSARRYSELVCMALSQSADTKVPSTHKHAGHEKMLMAVAMRRNSDLGNRSEARVFPQERFRAHGH